MGDPTGQVSVPVAKGRWSEAIRGRRRARGPTRPRSLWALST